MPLCSCASHEQKRASRLVGPSSPSAAARGLRLRTKRAGVAVNYWRQCLGVQPLTCSLSRCLSFALRPSHVVVGDFQGILPDITTVSSCPVFSLLIGRILPLTRRACH